MDLSLLIKAHSGIAIVTLVIYIIRGVMMLANSSKTNSGGLLSVASLFTFCFLVWVFIWVLCKSCHLPMALC